MKMKKIFLFSFIAVLLVAVLSVVVYHKKYEEVRKVHEAAQKNYTIKEKL